MKTNSITFFIICISIVASPKSQAQDNQAILMEVEQQVWKPFVEALNTKNVSAYKAVHAHNTLRISVDHRGVIQEGEEYLNNVIEKWFSSLKELNHSIQFSFTNDLVSEKAVAQRGFYIYEYETGEEKEKKRIYGEFFVICTKNEKEKWKIRLDFDKTTQNNRYIITQEHFDKGRKLTF